jgi:hypothetical protein
MWTLTTLLIPFRFLKKRKRLTNNRHSIGTRTTLNLWCTIWIFANQLTFRFRALWFMAFPIAFRFFTHRFTFGFRCLTMCNTMWLFTYSNAFRAISSFASFIRAFNFAFRFFTFHIANCVFGLST